MQSTPNWSRRSFLSSRGLASSAGGFLGSLLEHPRAASSSRLAEGRSLCCVARRAMACEFSIYLPSETPRPIDVGETALAEIEAMEDLLTVYRADSPMSYVNQHAADGPVRVDARMFEVLKRAAQISEQTGGAFDASAGALVKAWGFFRGPRRVPGEDERCEALRRTGMRHVELNDADQSVRYDFGGLEINLGSIGKGHAIDRAIARIRAEHDVTSALMQGGSSSLYALGSSSVHSHGWLVGIENPYNPRENLATVRLFNRAMGTSGTANQYFEYEGRRYGHVLDPRRGFPADELAAVSVIAAGAATADALSTALFVLGFEGAIDFCKDHPEIAAVIVLKPEEGPASSRRPRVVTRNFSPGDVVVKPEYASPTDERRINEAGALQVVKR